MNEASQVPERLRLRKKGSTEYVEYVLASSVSDQCCMCGSTGLPKTDEGMPLAELSDGRVICSRECCEWAVFVASHDLVEASNEMAKNDRLVKAAIALRDDMLVRARARVDVIHGEQYRIVNAGNSAWAEFVDALEASVKA